jgi:hypothetical protein
MAEEAAEAHEAVDLVDVEGLAPRDAPQPPDIEGELGIVPLRPRRYTRSSCRLNSTP